MDKKDSLYAMTRRNFLKMAGTAAGALSLPAPLFALGTGGNTFNFSGWSPVRMGMLLPGGGFSPQQTESYLAGFDYCLKTSGCIEAGVSIELVKADSDGAVSVSALKRLLDEDGVSLVTGILNNAAASALRAFARDEKFVLVASSLGECMTRKTDVLPSTFHCSMNLWQANWAMGRWAAGKMGRSCVLATSIYDTGYDTLEAFRLGYQAAGGTVMETVITDTGSGAPNFDLLFSEMAAVGPDFIYALYSGAQGAEFMKAYASSELAGKIPLACSPYLLGGDVLTSLGPLASGIKTCLPWQSDLSAPGSADFAVQYAAGTGRKLEVFGLLGYETAGMILSALSVTYGKTKNVRALSLAFEAAAFSSPRGQLTMNPKTNATAGPLFIHKVAMEGGKPVTKAIAEAGCTAEYENKVRPMWFAARSGWHNAYLYDS